MMQSWFQKYRHALWFLLFGVLSAFYFVSQHLGLRYHVVHLPLDDWLPFWPGFIVFYVLWYFYVPGCMFWACFRARDVFYRQVAALFSGAFVCAAVRSGARLGSRALPPDLCQRCAGQRVSEPALL